MKKSMQKLISLLLALVLVAGAAPLSAVNEFADLLAVTAHAETLSGPCGTGVTYSLDTVSGAITISGNGAMTDYKVATDVPWKDSRAVIKSVIINNGVTNIGDFAFVFCSELLTAGVPVSVQRIGKNAFSGCAKLTSVEFGSASRLTDIDISAFDGCEQLSTFVLPSSIKSIAYYSFRNCASLVDVTFPEGTEVISDRAFYGCSSLSTIHIPATLTDIGLNVFMGCTALKSFTVSQYNSTYSSDSYGVLFNKDKTALVNYPIDNDRVSYSIPDSVLTVESFAFAGASHLESVYIPAGTNNIGDSAFAGCASLKTFNINGGNTNYFVDAKGVLLSRNRGTLISFPAGSTIETYEVAALVTSISPYAFYQCANLKRVTIPKTVTSIGEFALGFSSDEPTYYLGDMTEYYIDIYEDFKINCYMESAANRYAEKNGVGYHLLDQVWGGSMASKFESGTGTQDDPYIIMTGEQLYLLAGIINTEISVYDGQTVTYDMFNNKCYKLGSDINLNYTNNWEKWFAKENPSLPEHSWTPIGGFFGVFDGNNHTINGVYVGGVADNKGLFSTVVGGTIKNLGLYKGYFIGGSNVGSIAGELSGGTVLNCYAYSNVSAATSNAGGIVGKNSQGEVIGCYSGGYVSGTYDCVGGIVGLNNQNVTKCFNVATVSGRNKVGGIVGNNTGTVATSYCVAAIESNIETGTGIGAVLGTNSGTVSRCYYLYSSAAGGVNGTDVPTQTQALFDSEMRVQSSFVSWDFGNDWTLAGNADYPYPEIAGRQYAIPVLQTYKVTASVLDNGAGGSISPSGEIVVAEGTTLTCVITPDEGYSIMSVAVDDVMIEATGEYVFEDIDANHKISVVFKANEYDAYFYPGEGIAFNGNEPGEAIVVPTAFASLPIAPTPPELEDYQFDGWEPELAPMTTAGATYTATYVESHIHDYSFATETVNPTCTINGSVTHTCRCGETQVEVLYAPGHTWAAQFTVDSVATCTSAGIKSIHCTVCDEKDPLSITVMPATGHNWAEEFTIIVAPTCTENGREARYCTNDDCNQYNYVRQVPALGHSYPEENYNVTLPAGCTTEGSELCQCANGCGNVNQRVIPAKGHSYGNWIITRQPTCASNGEQTRICPVCDDVQTQAILKRHTPQADYTVDMEPTCVYPGSKSIHCAACGEHTSVTSIPETGHSFGSWVTVRAASSTMRGMENRICSDCGCTEIRFTSSLAANFTVSNISSVTYSGKAQCPALTVKSSSGAVLTENVDYFVEYFNNIDAGTADAVVTGMGQSVGSVDAKFTISPADIASDVTVAPVPACNATGLPLHPEVFIKLGTLTVLPSDGYTLSYVNNVNTRSGSVLIKGVRNFTGTKTVSFNITAGSETFTVDAIAPVTYASAALTPAVTVRNPQGIVLSPTTDYTVTYANNIKSGYGSAVVVGKGVYSGTVTVYFVINPRSIALATAPQLSGGSFDYSKKTPAFEMYDEQKLLVVGADYTVAYVNNTVAGEAKAVISGTGSYCGQMSVPFTIQKTDIGVPQLSVQDPYFTDSPVKPVLTITLNGRQLREGADYTAVYSNNTAIGSNTARGVITGVGSFSGTRSITFSVLNNPVSGITLSESNVSVGYDSTITIKADVQPATATNRRVVWAVTSGGSCVRITPSSDTLSCAVKGIGKGTATITATTEDGDFVARCTVNATMTFFQRIIAFFRSLFGGSNSVMRVLYTIK